MNAIKLSRISELTGNGSEKIKNNTLITDICRDSKYAKSGSAFFCLVGARFDGHDYALSAYEKGCRVFVCEKQPKGFPIRDAKVFICKGKSSRDALADISAEFYGHPENEMQLIGITGTKGKTTTACMIYSVLNGCGKKTGYIGTNGVRFEGYSHETTNTTPESNEIFGYLRLMCDNGVKTAVIEVSSQALMTGRVRGVMFDTCVFTNLSPDHIGEFEHRDFDHYKMCKKKLFSEHCKRFAVINKDSKESEEMAKATPKEVYRFGFSVNKPSSYMGKDIKLIRDENGLGCTFVCETKNGSVNVRLSFPGDFSVMNGLACIAVCRIYGCSLASIAKELNEVRIDGRYETVTLGQVNYVIDYAHNGESLRSALTVLREYKPGKLICLYGSVGGRTRNRRKEMGDVASELADVSILTADNPDCEDPECIIDEIAKSYGESKVYYKEPDRKKAIALAVGLATAGDIVLLAGKGHENYQLICGKKEPFCEKEELKRACEAEATVV